MPPTDTFWPADYAWAANYSGNAVYNTAAQWVAAADRIRGSCQFHLLRFHFGARMGVCDAVATDFGECASYRQPAEHSHAAAPVLVIRDRFVIIRDRHGSGIRHGGRCWRHQPTVFHRLLVFHQRGTDPTAA
ncbi:hypothetical protein GCM10009641_26940 [Mycobacterium cookii]|uniref:Uncharacterized protein n=1 Tax=Mycobacterium cookii TaxID=1775 RepID=A0A7I7KRG9_9MYCO|nr:hypothetical protein MCOO_07300 [Mycobacterium cookii]